MFKCRCAKSLPVTEKTHVRTEPYILHNTKLTNMGGENTCQVCISEPHKYKCPGCLLKYCSVACYKSHKEKECKSARNSETDEFMKVKVVPEHEIDKDILVLIGDDDESEDRVPREMLTQLRRDPELLAKLRNPHLREVLRCVDSSNNPEKAIHKAMLEPLFTEFSDSCLSIVEPNRCNSEFKILKDQIQ